MKKIYKVSRVNETNVDIIPYDENACATCSGSCSGCHVVLQAKNPKGFELKPGMTVKANVSTGFQSFCNVIALVLPIMFAVAGFFLAPSLANLFHAELTETFKAFTVILFLFVPALVIFLLTRKRSELVELQITSLISD
ncbi:MAG: SoxR reducing system RseC family protein [Treponema sp.]|nr:SoxR reducing system RseC family protein [Treponema sp.]